MDLNTCQSHLLARSSLIYLIELAQKHKFSVEFKDKINK